MNKLRQLEARKLLKELDYVKSDFEYKNEIVFEADSAFLESLNGFLEKNIELKEIFEKKTNARIDMIRERSSENAVENSPSSVEIAIVDKAANENIRKIYRIVAKKTHPDKISDARLNEIYITAREMYESNDVMGIYSICDQLGIPYEISVEDLGSLKDRISIIKDRVAFMESTFSWKWHHSKDEGERSRMLFEYVKSKII